MAFTLNQFQSVLNKGAGTVAGATAATVINHADKVDKAVDKTFAAAGKATSAMKGAMPASNKKVDSIAAKFNTRLNNLEMGQRVTDVKLSMLSQATGVQFPTDEEIVEALVEEDEAEQAAETAKAVVNAVANPEIMNMMGTLMKNIFGVNPFTPVDDEYEVPKLLKEVSSETVDEADIPEPVKEKSKVKMEQPAGKKSGRKKLGRQAPLAE